MSHIWRKLTSSGDADGALDGLKLLGVDEGRVGEVCDVDLAILEESDDVLGTEAVADTTKALDAQLALELLDDGVDDGVDLRHAVATEPLHELEAGGHVDRHGIAVEEVGNDGEVAVGGELVGEAVGVRRQDGVFSLVADQGRGLQLDVDELMAEDVGKDQDGVLGALVLGVGKVGADCEQGERAVVDGCRSWGDVLPATFSILPAEAPSCLKPVVQHFPGGLEAILCR